MYLAKTNSGHKYEPTRRSDLVGFKRDWINIVTRRSSAGYRMKTLVSKAHGIERNRPWSTKPPGTPSLEKA